MARNNELNIQVMMVGGRRCGKTSVLAAMKANFQQQFAKTQLTLEYDDLDTLEVLEAKNNEIKDYFLEAQNRIFTPDSNPTEEMSRYTLSISLPDKKKGTIRVDFVDYPGEWLTDKEHREDILECMKETQVIIVAIDTPHMMEENGKFNEYRNYCSRTSEMLKMALGESYSDRKLVLFIPLKCERYLNEGKMGKVREQTEKSYAELINYLARSPEKYEVAVTPIFTLGSAEFSHFEVDRKTGNIKINETYKTPENPIYRFPDIGVKKPEPKYCEQPIVYLLAYIFQSAGDKKNKEYKKVKNFIYLIKLLEWFWNIASAEDFLAEKSNILNSIKRNGDGYHIIQDPMKFNQSSV